MRCSDCGFDNPAGFCFCGQCGTPLVPTHTREGDVGVDEIESVGSAERRQLTVVFCDIMGSSAFAERLDPEELRDVILSYRKVCGSVVEHYTGYIGRLVGDGILIYFGYPRAHEDDAIRAVRAALAIVAEIKRIGAELRPQLGADLAVHIGIHTGLVIVGELGSGTTRENLAIVGETPNIAARLEQLAGANSIFVSDTTFRIARPAFQWRERGLHQLKGLSKPVAVFEPLSEAPQRGSLERMSGRELTPLAGRTEELQLLMRRWDQAVDGSGQVILVTGEPGIGKSRLLQAFEERLEDAPRRVILCNCDVNSTESALHPFIQALERYAEIRRDEPATSKLEKLEMALRAVAVALEAVIPFIAPLLLIPVSERYSTPELSAHRQREQTMDSLLSWVMGSQREPVLLVVEDVHWADPSTIDFLSYLIDQVPTTRTLVLVTARPEFSPPWRSRSHLSQLMLQRLSRPHTVTIVQHLTKQKPLPHEVLNELVSRTDGVPLFVEELTKMLLESGALTERPDQFELTQPIPTLLIPATLRDSLMARLDRLDAVKRTVQLAAILGKEFSYELLRAVSRRKEEELQHNLAQLVAGEFLYQRGLPPNAAYSFKHSLIHDTAYRSVLRAKRRDYHRRTATVLTERFAALTGAQPELAAHHYTLAGMPAEAVRYWRAAGERALEKSANVEAAAHLSRALSQLAQLPAIENRNHDELMLLVSLGAAQTATKGYGAPEVARTYARARELCESFGEAPQLFPSLRGLQSYYQVHGPLDAARDLGLQLLRLADRSDDNVLRVEAKRRVGWCLFCMGQMHEGSQLLDEAIALYDAANAHRHAMLFGSDPKVLGLVNSAWLRWFIGDPEEAVARSSASIALARELRHPLSLAYGLCMSAAMYQCRREPDNMVELLREAVQLSNENGFPYWLAWSRILEGWTLVQAGNIETGMRLQLEALDGYRRTGSELFRPYSLSLIAETCEAMEDYERGLAFIEEGLASGKENQVFFFEPELHRLKGKLLLSRGSGVEDALPDLLRSIAIARRQGALLPALRTAAHLYKLRHGAHSGAKDRKVLEELFQSVRGARASADLLDAAKQLGVDV
jgi:TOMM system kinase/cyclase fusion protein